MLARAQALMSESALTGNLSALARQAGARVLLPVKADAYGHGLEIVARLAARHPEVWGFGVALPREAAALAALDLGRPILLLTPPMPEEVQALADLGVRLPVASVAEAEHLPPHARAHLKVDTGMNRLGARPEEALEIGLRLAERGLLEGAYTHFATADEPDLSFAHAQLERFRTVLDALPPGVLAHASNGGGVLSFGPVPGLSLVRPGLASYGFAPEHLRGRVPLTPVMTLRARITHVHAVRPGESVSYGALWRAERETVVATVGIGYADGYPRNATGHAHVLVAGERRPVLGRICMDQMMVDVTHIPGAAVGDQVTLVGSDGGETITMEEISAQADSFNYEFVCGISRRVPRQYVQGGKTVHSVHYLLDAFL